MDVRSGTSRALLALLLTPGLGQTLVSRCVEAFGSADAAMGASAAQLAGIRGISGNKAGTIRRGIDATVQSGAVERELEAVESAGAKLIGIGEAAYPPLLARIPDRPVLLWVRGELEERDSLLLGIVGSRKCTAYGREQAERFAAGCATAGLTITSGGAYGVDAAAHWACLRLIESGATQVRTIAVIGSGLNKPYPSDHAELFDRLVASGQGALVSELPMFTPPRAEQFPARNRIISGLSLGVLVIEAANRSGALITARLAVEEHGRECMALPGRVDSPASAGCHKLLRDGGATLVTSPSDVLDQLGEAGGTLKDALPAPSGMTRDTNGSLWDDAMTGPQQKLLAALDQKRTLDELLAATGLTTAVAQSELTMLELTGTITRSGGFFTRRRC